MLVYRHIILYRAGHIIIKPKMLSNSETNSCTMPSYSIRRNPKASHVFRPGAFGGKLISASPQRGPASSAFTFDSNGPYITFKSKSYSNVVM